MSKLVVLDLETYYDREFSLSKITTEEYIRSPLYETIGIAIKINGDDTQWYPQPDVEAALKAIDWSDAIVVAQNTMFDGAILKWRYGVDPMGWVDIMGMSRALYPHEKSHSLGAQAERAGVGQKGDEVINALGKRYKDFDAEALARYAAYCCMDVDLTHSLFMRYMQKGFPRQELRLLDLTLRMYIDAVLELDAELLKDHLHTVKLEKEALLNKLNADDKARLMSNPQLAEMLRERGVEPPMKVSPTTGKQTYAFAKTDEAFKALLEHEDLEVQAIVAARLGVKSTLEETRTERFIAMAHRGKFPVPLRYYGAHSGRWSGDQSVNLQNLPSRGANAGKIKRSVKPPPGYVFIDSDSAQIEARTLAWLAGQDDLVEAFEQKKDVYRIMASYIYGVAPDQISKEQRFIGKTTVLGAGYGVGFNKLKLFLKTGAGVDVSEAEAKRIVDTYRKTYYRIPQLWEKADTALVMLASGMEIGVDVHGLVRSVPNEGLSLPNELYIRYPNLRQVPSEKGGLRWVYDSRGQVADVYGGKCLSADTEVLTERGWVRIVEVKTTDRVWDGIEWVNHHGLTYQGYKPTIVLNGVRMTADHKVLTSMGWRDASSCERLHGTDFWMPDGSAVRGSDTTFSLGVPMHMWNPGYTRSNRRREVRQTRGDFVVRLSDGQESADPCNVKTSSLLGLAVNAGSLQATHPSGMAQLWGAWDNCVRSLGSFVRKILGGYGSYLSTGANARSYRQQPWILTKELSLGTYGGTGWESTRRTSGGYYESSETNRGTEINPFISMASEPVYDLINAGPRSRFVVRGDAEPFIVHNCVENFTQAIARCIIAEQMLRIAKRYKVVLTVHDAIGCIAPVEEQEEAVRFVEECMSWRPTWAVGLPLACEVGWGASYGDC